MNKILFADNDPDFLNTRSEFLKAEGYQVLEVPTFDQADQLLRDTWVHLAIVDIRLTNDDDEKDISGLLLAKSPPFRSVPKIMLTNFPSYQHVREAMGPALEGLPPAVDFLAKQEGPEALISAANDAFIRHVRINWNLAIDWKAREPFSLVTLIEPGLEGERLLNRAEELEDLFRRLFYEKDHIRVDRLLWQREGRVALTVFAFKEGAASESFVVVCGQNAVVNAEAEHYRDFAPKAPGETGTALTVKAETTHFAANAYTLAGADLENVCALGELYRSAERKLFASALETLSQETLFAWHQDQRVREECTLEELYREQLGLTEQHTSRETLEGRVQALVRQIPRLGPQIERDGRTLTIHFDRQSFTYPDPIPVLYQATDIGQPVMTTNTPGTLSGDNILADASSRTWLTDFADARRAPLLWNFVALEAAIRFDWVETNNLQRRHEMERCLVDSEFAKLAISDVEPIVRKPVRTIQVIRRLAARTVGKDVLPYHLGIMFHAASRLTEFNPAFPLTPNELARLAHALIAAGMICAKTAQTKSASVDAAPVETGLRIDKTNHVVSVEGRRVSVSPQEFKLLSYLYDHANQLCAHQEIIKQVLDGKYDKGYLHTMIGRLRDKIEPDKDHPRYLVTERSVGYRLVLQPKE